MTIHILTIPPPAACARAPESRLSAIWSRDERTGRLVQSWREAGGDGGDGSRASRPGGPGRLFCGGLFGRAA